MPILGTLTLPSNVTARGRSRMTKAGEASKATVDLVWKRDGGRCARCGIGLTREDRGYTWSLHHRRPRGMGGSRISWVNEAANLLVLCGTGTTGCHGWVEKNRGEARDLGWLVPVNAAYTPHEVAVSYPDGLFWLTDYGTRETEKPLPF